MDKKLFSRNITFDTSFLESQNFLTGSKVMQLSDVHHNHGVNLYTTDIFYREILARFEKNINQAIEGTIKPKDLLKKNARVLRNFMEFDTYFNLPKINSSELCDRFKLKFDSWLKEHEVEIIPTGHLTIKDVFEDYFDNSPPFKNGEKKHEFPDAFSLKAIISFFDSKNDKSYILTSDNDILTYNNPKIIGVKASSDLFDLIIRTTKQERIEKTICFIESSFAIKKSQLEKDTKEMIIAVIEDEVGSEYMFDDLEIENVNYVDLSDVEFESFSILKLSIEESSAILECKINISFEVSFSAMDFSDGYYDSEDKVWHLVTTKNFSIDDDYDLSVQISVEFALEEECCEFEVENIENGEKLNVFDSFKRW